MPWPPPPLTARRDVLARDQTRLWRMTARCPRVGMRRHPGETWRGRAMPAGLSGLQETPRVPRPCPHRSAPASAAVLLEAMRLPPTGGPRTIGP